MSITRLPEDALLEIFLLCSEADWDGNYPAFRLKFNWDWIIITHVSRYWRNLALSSPFLWRKPSLVRHSRDRLEAFLERSRNTPLIIHTDIACKSIEYGNAHCDKCKEITIVALAHLSRIRFLYISFADFRVVNAMLDRAAPLLEDLTLTSVINEDIPLPDNFLASHTPSLKSIEFEGFRLPYNPGVLRGLEVLKLQNSLFAKEDSSTYLLAAPCYPTLQDLIDIAAASSFREINLYTLRDSTGPSEDRAYTFDLRRLLRFQILEMDVAMYQRFLRHFHIPFHTNVKLGVRYSNWRDYSYILDVLEYILECKRCEALRLVFDDNHVVGHADTIYKSISESTFVEEELSVKSVLRVIQTLEDGRTPNEEEVNLPELFAIIVALIEDSCWRNTTSLSMHISTSYVFPEEQDHWHLLLDSFGRLEDLKWMVMDPFIRNMSNMDDVYMEKVGILERGLISTLALQSEHNSEGISSESVSKTVILPHLKSIDISLSSLTRHYDLILHCLRVRKDSGCPVRCLRVSTSDRTHRDLPNWRSEIEILVDEFHCPDY